MKVVATSDFHGTLPEDVPPCDLLIVAGDVLSGHALYLGLDLPAWIARQPAERIVAVAGNHDFIAEANPLLVREGFAWTYLQDEGCEVFGRKIWGSPYAKTFGSWAFMEPDEKLAERWALIPDDTEILVVHGPAYGLLDKTYSGEHVGSHTLLDRIRKLPDLKLLVTGHIHEAYGTTAYPVPSSPFDCAGPRWIQVVNASRGFLGRVGRPITVEV